MLDKNNITGIILAGGKSSRMGTDKGFLILKNKPFVQYSIDALSPLVSKIIIVSNNPDYDVFMIDRIEDVIKNAGPVAGIYSALEASSTEYNLILSCDIPLITSEILQELIDFADDTHDIIQMESDGKSMPLIALYKKQVAKTFYSLLQQDERRLRIAVNNCKVKNIVLDKHQIKHTMNVNTQTEYKTVENEYND
ncbi:molybdenum cofactor guanylyltransferase [Sabulilitoribacter multivorans]|uniref:Probable molybdenum cofactor guanylyltransferase n=1 Tax=Flaviramulus multivorans TaxID=1304750 RepID=A0ABS9IHH2_9FLAO|nr:molybdenum cofactor guanylyltransferase [Flaviramulus multivorans]MCF7560174.1 molybdenum cofactor guanylyltransferase [Flaviramulus multivorans]